MWSYLAVALLLIAGLQAESEDVVSKATLKMRSFLESRCRKNADANALEELNNAGLGFKTCLVQPKPPHSEEELYNMVCVEMPQIAYSCLSNILSKVKPCLDEEEKYLPDFFLDTFNSSVKESCEGGVSEITQLVHSVKNSECAASRDNIKQKLVDDCKPQLKLVHEIEDSNFVLRKSDLCSDLKIIKSCAISVLNDVCEDDAFSKLFETSIGPLVDWCSQHESI